jgi:hypothetical protein
MARLKKRSLADLDYYVSPDIIATEQENLGIPSKKETIDSLCDEFREAFSHILYNNPLHKEFLEQAQQHTNTNRIAVLDAHGNTRNNQWVYCSGGEQRLVQSWIRKQDGLYAAIFMHCCNADAHSIATSKSLLFVPSTTVSYNDIINATTHIELVAPYVRHIDPVRAQEQLEQYKAYVRRSQRVPKTA